MIANEPLASTTIISIGKLFAFTSLSISPTFLISFIIALDDMWWYQYHRVDYPNSANYFISNVNLINTIRLDPSFLQFFSFLNAYDVGEPRNNIALAMISQHKNNPT